MSDGRHPQMLNCQRVCNKSNTMDATSGAGTTYPSRAPELVLVGFVLLDY